VEPYFADDHLTIYQGDSRAVMADLPAESVHCVVTSPPYWGLRDYGVPGQLGLEATPEAYVAALVDVFREVRRVLRPDGTVWLNLGDSYASKPAGVDGVSGSSGLNGVGSANYQATLRRSVGTKQSTLVEGLPEKNLVGIPWRVAFALQADGWYLRSDIIWSKPNPMPESITDRPTKAHEYLFLLSRSPRYFYDAEAVREPSVGATAHDVTGPGYAAPGQTPQTGARRQSASALSFDRETKEADVPGQQYKQHRLRRSKKPDGWATHDGGHGSFHKDGREAGEAAWIRPGRNLRTVWTIATEPYPGAHFATFPQKLVEPCVKAGTSERGVCLECGAPWVRVVERTPNPSKGTNTGVDMTGGAAKTSNPQTSDGMHRNGTNVASPSPVTIGWRPTCAHAADEPVPAVVLDPFAGTGTVGLVAQRLGRRAVLIELNAEYADQAIERCKKPAPKPREAKRLKKLGFTQLAAFDDV
jgi:DNA modification methylase